MKRLIPIVIALLIIASPVMADIDTGLVGYWKLDEGSGFTTVDETVYGNDGTLGGNTSWVAHSDGYAVDFDAFSGGSYQDRGMARIDLGNDTALDLGGGELTISVWTQYQGILASSSIVLVGKANDNANNIDYWFGTYNDKGNIFWGYNWEEGMNGNLTLVDDSWYHMVWTFNSTYSALYINDSLDVSKTHSTPLGSTIGHAVIGGLVQDLATEVYMNAYNGTIDEVRIYDRMLSSSDVTELYNYVPCEANFTLNTSVEECYNSTNLRTNDTYYDLNTCDMGNLTYSIISAYNLLPYSLTSQADSCFDSDTQRTTYIYNDTETCGYGISNYTDASCVNQEVCLANACQIDNSVPFVSNSAIPGMIIGAGILITLLSIIAVPPSNTKELVERIIGAVIVISLLAGVSGMW